MISSITVQGTRRNEPPNFADVGETVAVTAAVTDAETNVDSLQYNWTATLGSFTGTGARVSWVAPAAAFTPVAVTITLEVVERFGTNQENRVTKTAMVALHDNTKEVGRHVAAVPDRVLEAADEQGLSTTSCATSRRRCARMPGEVIEGSGRDVSNHYSNFFMHSYRLRPGCG